MFYTDLFILSMKITTKMFFCKGLQLNLSILSRFFKYINRVASVIVLVKFSEELYQGFSKHSRMDLIVFSASIGFLNVTFTLDSTSNEKSMWYMHSEPVGTSVFSKGRYPHVTIKLESLIGQNVALKSSSSWTFSMWSMTDKSVCRARNRTEKRE